MDRREAIKILENERDTDVFVSDYRNRVHEALDLAIEALKKVSVYEQVKWERDMALKTLEEHGIGLGQIVEETSTNEGVAESATTTDCKDRGMRKYINISKLRDEYAKKKIGRTGRAISQTYTFGSEDCISRKQAVEALTGWETEPLDEDIVRTLNNLPPVNKKQITGKLETAETATSEGEESTMNQPKSKLDLISRQEVLGYIDRLTGSGLGKMKSLEYIKKYVERMESSVAPKPVGDCISRKQAVEEIALHDCTNGEVSYFTGRGVQEILNTLPPVTPTERTGEWAAAYLDHESVGVRPRTLYCSECNWLTSFPSAWCPHCGAKMGGE